MLPRGRSGWRGSGSNRGRAPRRDAGNHKTSSQPCRQFIRGNCRYGEDCKFSHDQSVIADSSSETQTTENSEAREEYFEFRRSLKSHQQPILFRFSHSQTSSPKLWTQALTVLNGGNREWQMSIARDLAEDSSGGTDAILQAIHLSSSALNNSRSEITEPFLQVITHDFLIDCRSVETYMGTIYRVICGTNGDRAVSLFSSITEYLTQSSLLVLSTMLPLVALALYELLRRERKVLLHDGLQPLFNSLEKLTTHMSNHNGVQSGALQAVSVRLTMMRRMSAIERDRLVAPQSDNSTIAMQAHIRSTFPIDIKIPGANHDNDFADIKDIAIYPTQEELMCEKAEFLPTTDFTQPHFLSDPVRRHLDAAFRLLRHDIFGPLKDVVGPLLSEDSLVQANMASPSVGGNTRVHAYGRAGVAHIKIRPKFGLEADICFATPTRLRGKSLSEQRNFWQESSMLDEGGLVAFVQSNNGTKSFLLLIVTKKNTAEGKGDEKVSSLVSKGFQPSITVKLASETLPQILVMNQLYVNKQQGMLIELPGLIPETFVPILENLQRMMQDGNLAFQKWILPSADQDKDQPKGRVTPPVYACRPGFKFRLDSISPDEFRGLSVAPRSPDSADMEAIQRATGLDLGQCHGLVAALTREYALLQGPPGTGKSHVGVKLLRVLLDHKDEGKLGPIVVICYTNHALDQFLKHLLHVGINKVIRIGGQSRAEELDGKNLRVVRQMEPKTSVESKILGASYSEVEESLNSAGNKLKPIHSARKNRLDWDTLQPFLIRTYPQIARQLEPQDDDGFTLVRTDPLKVWLGKRGAGRTRATNVLRREAERDATSLNHAERWTLAESWLDEMVTQASDALFERLDHARKYRQRINDVHADTDRRTLLKADVIGVTTTGLARNIHTLRHLRSKVIICEEAGEILEPHLLSALMPGVEHFIQIGDHRQLRPQIQNYLKFSLETAEGQAYQLDRSQFERRAMGEPGLEPLEVATLDVQRRMRPEISALISSVYPNLKNHDTVHSHPNVVGMRDNLYWLDHNHPEDSRDDGHRVKSHSNTWEVSMATALVRHLVRQGQYKSTEIALLTPYTGQLQKLRTVLNKDFEVVLSERDLEAMAQDGFDTLPESNTMKPLEKKQLSSCLRLSTVDNYQGEESDVVCVSLVRSNDRGKVGFLKTVNRIVVLLSRARHGFFLIGNAKTYREIPMWNEVIQKLKAGRRIGEQLYLCCPRHPDLQAICSEPEDFDRYSPEGGCNLICEKRLAPCGHQCTQSCHSDQLHEVFSCLQPCHRLRTTCHHRCLKLCGEQCGPCKFRLDNVKLPCGHTVHGVLCHETLALDDIHCPHPVEKVVPGGCGHTVTVDCSTKVEDFKCPSRCDAMISCGHHCPGTCGSCRKPDTAGTVTYTHQACRQRCDRPYGTCTHTCKSLCHDGTPCGSCTRQCEVKCSHSRCAEPCHKPCFPCIEKCTWSCEHRGDCTLPCAAPCNRLPCDKRCTLRLKCGHFCPSYCGEECPQDLCQICCNEDLKGARVDMFEFRTYAEIDLDESPIVVLGCRHFFTGETLDGMLGMGEVYTTDKTGAYNGLQELSGQLATKVPACPDCRVPIRQFSTRRYNRVINRAVMDQTLKRFLVDGRQWLQEITKQVDAASKTLTKSREAYLARNHLFAGHSMLQEFHNPAHTADRYTDIINLKRQAAKLGKDLGVEHQPHKKLFDAIVTFQRHVGRLSGLLEDQMSALDISESLPLQPVYNQQVTAEAGLLCSRIQEIELTDMLMLLSKSSQGLSKPNLPVLFFQSCKKVIEQGSDAKLPRIVIQATLHYARIAQLYSCYLRSRPAESLPVAEEKPSKNKQQPNENIHDTAKELLEKALDLCNSFGGGADYLSEVEEMLRLYTGPRYEEVTPEELQLIKQAMVTGRGGISTHSGHWYNCENGHPFAIGECGMPMEQARCPECGAKIGGQDHQAVAGVTRATNME
ncbi:hypothetical protein QBC43DRAFT_269827 [Cladorrhinum sp. PSN259]|nr:hypothetical protein QBC43DRAFT_269827 [Cladorrhinum sp. PSN259]